MVIAPLLAIILLATTTLKVSEAVVLFSGGAVAWSLGEYGVPFLCYTISRRSNIEFITLVPTRQ